MSVRFFDLAGELCAELRSGEQLLLAYRGEASDFVRLNRNRIRQAGHVCQGAVELELVAGQRHVTAQYELQGQKDTDLLALNTLLSELREQLAHLPDDPYLLIDTVPRRTQTGNESALPGSASMTDALRRLAQDLDLVGLLAAGSVQRGFASSLGHRHWHAAASFHLDWSVHHRADKAVKGDYAGQEWSEAELAERLQTVRRQLEIVQRPPKHIDPGEYRAYLAPAAVRDLLDMMAWGGFGLKSHRSGQSPLIKMVREGRTLSPAISLCEHPSQGVAPLFADKGFTRPGRTPLIEDGSYREFLVDPRSAQEFGVAVTGSESPDSLDLAPGSLRTGDLLARLDTGLWIENLWYCNFSDRSDCRITGMTRFACFWVEHGRIVAPVDVMRFDDSIYRLLGEQLVGLTQEREFILDNNTYGERSTRSYRLPGILVDGMRFTL